VNPLFGLDNVVITPHAAYYSDEAIGTVRNFARVRWYGC
jgi:D-3-phosphoglycerate dehydrogenase